MREVTVDFKVHVDDFLILRIESYVNGEPVSCGFGHAALDFGVTGLALGVKNTLRWPEVDGAGRLRLGSCSCGAFDCRLSTVVRSKSGHIVWAETADSRTGEVLPDLYFDKRKYLEAVDECKKSLAKIRWRYIIRIWWARREGSLPFGLVAGPTELPLFVLGFLGAVLLPGGVLWFIPALLGIFWWSFYSARWPGLWLTGPDDPAGRGCRFHWSSVNLPDNWWHTTWPQEDERR